MIPLSTAIGACIGAFVGLLNSGVITSFVLTPLQRRAAAPRGPDVQTAQRRILVLRRVLLVLVIFGFAACGALFGHSMIGRGL